VPSQRHFPFTSGGMFHITQCTHVPTGASGSSLISVTAIELTENVPLDEDLPDGSRQGITDFRRPGYGGPAPPSGTHRYYLKIYALDIKLDLSSSSTKSDLLKAMEGHILAEGQLMGKYKRR